LVDGGTLIVASGGVLGLDAASVIGPDCTITFKGGSLQYGPLNASDYSSEFSQAPVQAYAVDTNGQTVAFATPLTSTNGSFTKLGAGTLTFNVDNTYTGGTNLNGGVLSLGSANALGFTGPITFGGGALQFSSANTSDYSPRFSTAPGQHYNLDTNGQTVALATALGSSGGSLTKLGTGTLFLTGANTYSGATTVSNGALLITTTSAANGNYTVANGATLGVTNVSGSALVFNLTVAAGSTLEFRNVASATTPLIAASNVTVGGSCTVKITGTNGLVAGGTYPLIQYAGILSGAIANLQLQMPYGWRATLVNGGNRISLANVAVVSTVPPQMSVTPVGQQVRLFWPQPNTGWRLQAQTNASNAGLGTNWADIPATSTNQISLFMNPASGSVFFRLIYP